VKNNSFCLNLFVHLNKGEREYAQITPAVNKNKKIFIIVAILFLIIILLVGIDISSRTTFPGSKGNLEERLQKNDGTGIKQEIHP